MPLMAQLGQKNLNIPFQLVVSDQSGQAVRDGWRLTPLQRRAWP